jgi:chromosome segregation ATPase
MRWLQVISLLFALQACNSPENAHNRVSGLKVQADSLQFQLSKIDTSFTNRLSQQSDSLREKLRFADTLTIEEAKMLSSYFNAADKLKTFPGQLRALREAADSSRARLDRLSSDIERQAGDRTLYSAYIDSEQKEMDSLEKHVFRLLGEQEKARSATAQFKDPIERFIRRFAVP